jgi:hypothetical protein
LSARLIRLALCLASPLTLSLALTLRFALCLRLRLRLALALAFTLGVGLLRVLLLWVGALLGCAAAALAARRPLALALTLAGLLALLIGLFASTGFGRIFLLLRLGRVAATVRLVL